MQRTHASDDRHAPAATNDLKVWGKFSTTMAAKDWSMSFDFGGIYSEVIEHKQISYEMEDGRKVNILFEQQWDSVKVIETFDSEMTNPAEMQRAGRQAILDNFKKYVESVQS